MRSGDLSYLVSIFDTPTAAASVPPAGATLPSNAGLRLHGYHGCWDMFQALQASRGCINVCPGSDAAGRWLDVGFHLVANRVAGGDGISRIPIWKRKDRPQCAKKHQTFAHCGISLWIECLPCGEAGGVCRQTIGAAERLEAPVGLDREASGTVGAPHPHV